MSTKTKRKTALSPAELTNISKKSSVKEEVKDCYLFTMSHKTAPIPIREKFAIHDLKLEEAYKEFKKIESITSCLIISTCNRTEVYFKSENIDKATNDILDFFENFLGLEHTVTKEYFELYHGDEIVEKAFRVAAGMDSLIVGERQILSQLKYSYTVAQQEKILDNTLERLFQNAILKAKEIHANTNISKGAQSVSSAAVDIANKVYGPIKNLNVVVLGAGRMAKLALERITELGGAKNTYVLNRSPHKIIEFPDEYRIDDTFPFEKVYDVLNDVDLLICAAGAPHFILFAKDFKKKRINWNRKLTIIDISLPRNIDSEFGKTPNVELIDIDSMQALYGKTYPVSDVELEKVDEMIEFGKEEFYASLTKHNSSDLIKDLKEKVERVRTEKLTQLKGSKNTFTLEELDYITKNILNTVMHAPIKNLKDTNVSNLVKEKLIKELFDI